MKSITLFIIFIAFTINKNERLVQFSKIEYSSFDVNSHRTIKKDSIYIQAYCTINQKGLVNIYNPGDLQDSPKIYYAIQLSNTQLNKLSSVFYPENSLMKNLARKKLDKNEMYAGSYDYFRVFYQNGTIDSFCVIIPFATLPIKEISDLIDDALYRRKDRIRINEFKFSDDFINSLKSCYIKSDYLPEIKNPPPFMIHN